MCKAQGRRFRHHRTFQLPIHRSAGAELQRLPLQQRGHFAFDGQIGFEALQQRTEDGWTVQTTRLTPSYGWRELKERMGEPGRDWLLLGGWSRRCKVVHRHFAPTP